MLDGSCELLAVGNVQYLLFMADCRRTLSFSKPWLRLETVKRFQLQVVRLWNIRCELWLDIIAIVTIHLLWKSWYYIIWDWAHCCSAYLYLVLCYFCRTERYNVNMFAFQRNKLCQYNLQIALLEIRMMVIYYHFYEIPVWKKPPPKLIIESELFIFVHTRLQLTFFLGPMGAGRTVEFWASIWRIRNHALLSCPTGLFSRGKNSLG